MRADVEAGASYRLTRHGHEVGRIVPARAAPELIEPKKPGAACTSSLEAITPKGGLRLDQLLAETRGDW